MKLKAVVILSLLIALGSGARAAEPFTNAYEAITLFTQVLEEVHRGYVHADEANYDALIRHALAGMLQALDPYSQFMDARSYDDMKEETSGHFGGIGIVISMRTGVLTVVSPMEDTPGFRAGIQSGDIIIEINGEETRELSLSEAIQRMRGEPGTEVRIKTLRPATRDTKEIPILREEIRVASVKDAKMLHNKIGYVRITQFNEPTGGKLKAEIHALMDKKMTALVLDLRGNPGGLLTAAVDVAELFLERGKMIVSTQGRDGMKNGQRFKSGGNTHFTRFPLAILVNEGSASASEIVAGALQDHNRAVLVGEKTFGKGSVQSILPLPDGSAIKLTTAKYYTPSERVIHDHGIEPDIQVKMSAEDFYKIRQQQAAKNGEAETLKENELRDIQVETALGALNGMLIQQEWGQ